MRGGRISESNIIELYTGDEIWFKPASPVQEFVGKATLIASDLDTGHPIVRVVWYRGGRLEVMHQDSFKSPDGVMSFRAWPPEDDGWFGILVDGNPAGDPLRIEIDRIQPR